MTEGHSWVPVGLDSDDIVAYVRLLASAYIRLTPDMHASVFHPDDPTTVISAPDFCSIYVEQLGQDAGEYKLQGTRSRTHEPQIIFKYLR